MKGSCLTKVTRLSFSPKVEFLISADVVLPDQLNVKEAVQKTGPGPHVITGPIYVEDAQPGDVLEIKTVEIDYRIPYGVISNRHGRGAR